MASAAAIFEFASAFTLSADVLASLYTAWLVIYAVWQRAWMVSVKFNVAVWWHVWKSK